VPLFAHAGLALSVSLGACANALALYVGLKRRGVYVPQAGWGRFLVRLSLVLVIFAAALGWVQLQIDWTAWQSAPWWRAGVLAAVIGAAIALYFIVLLAFGFRASDFRHGRSE
jgi:putative peptidoglycan lipid II flippase